MANSQLIKGSKRGNTISMIDDFEKDSLERAKEIVVQLSEGQTNINVLDLFYSDNLEEIEHGIKALNDYSSKAWLLSGLALYSLIYEKDLWQQSGLTWGEYTHQTSARLGLDSVTVSEQLASARFFVKYRAKLLNAGWTTKVANRNLARAEVAVECSGSVDETIEHLVNDSTRDFQKWYQSFKILPPPEVEDKRPDIVIEKSGIKINGINAVTISSELPENERTLLEGYLQQIYKAIKAGDVPAIVPVYDEKEARLLMNLRDKHRAGK